MLNAVTPSRLATDSHIAPLRPAMQTEAAASGFDPVTTHFQREAARIINASDLLDDKMSLSLMQKALGFEVDPNASRSSQAELISSMINFHDFQIPSKIQQFIQLYTLSGSGPGANASHEPVLPDHASHHVSDTVLASLQMLRMGGS